VGYQLDAHRGQASFAEAQAQLGRDRNIPLRGADAFGDAGWLWPRAWLLASLDVVAAVNANDAMARLIDGLPMKKGKTAATLSPAMDIQLPSNFERLLFDAAGRDGAAVANAYAQLANTGEAPLPKAAAAKLGSMGLSAERVNDHETLTK
jgi:threonine synthase